MTALEIASAMVFLHDKNIVHGDLSGGNVMLTSCSINPHGFQAKVGDFGLSRDADASAKIAGNVYGTITHMAPEVMLEATLGPPADVYGFGVLLWEMLTASRAWAGLRHAHIICMVGVQSQSLAVPEGLHPLFVRLLERCMQRRPEDRPTFKEIAEMLSRFVQMTRGTGEADLAEQESRMVEGSCIAGTLCCKGCGHACDGTRARCQRCEGCRPDSPEEGTASTPASTPQAEGYCTKSMAELAQPCQNHQLAEKAVVDKADQEKPCQSPRQSGKGVKRTSVLL